jgi:hypothetical protein
VAAAALAGRTDQALSLAASLEALDVLREARGEPPSGLADNVAELVAACDGSDAFPIQARTLLARGDLDPALRRRLAWTIANEPLERADASVSEDRQWKAGALFNRVVEPVSKLLLTGIANPVDSLRTTIGALLTAHRFPGASVRERRALRAWDEWLIRHPDDPRAPEVAERAQDFRAKLADERYERALEGAREALANSEFERARILAGRALQNRPESAPAAELLERADSEINAHDARVRESLAMDTLSPATLDASSQAAYVGLARAALVARAEAVAARAATWRAEGAPTEIGAELAFLETFGPLARGDEDGFFAGLGGVLAAAPPGDTIASQAIAIIRDPAQNPYAYYQAASSADRRAQLAWLALGSHANGPRNRDLPRPIEYVLELPAVAISLVTFPLRLIQYPSARPRFGQSVLLAGERYTERRPQGQHVTEIHRDLASRYAERGQAGAALRHEQALPDPDAETIAQYREQIAEQMQSAGERERRVDMRLAILASVARDYPDTPAGVRAKTEFIAQKQALSPQRIRLSHDFLVEHPELWAPGALELNAELLDGASRNGEIAEPGVALLGRTAIEISLEDREPVVRELQADCFARFAALLEQVNYTSLARDEREKPIVDPALDAFLASARLGVVEAPDMRPSARSDAVYQSTQEKHGFVNSHESILPVDLVLHGDIESLGMAAFPRIRLPAEPDDAMLYD